VARIVLCSGADRGHTYPAVALAEALHTRGHDTLVVTGRDRGPELDAAGTVWRRLPDAEPHSAPADPWAGLWARAAAAARPLAALVRAVGAEVVVGDVLLAAGGLAADLAGVPWVQLVPHHLTDAAVELPPVGLGRHPTRAPWVRADDRLIHRRTQRSLAAGRADRTAARASLGLAGAGGPAARLVASLPGLEYPRRRWPVDAHLVGPLAWDPPDDDAAEVLGGIDPDGPPVVVATDSTGTGARGGLAALAVEALAGLDLQLVATTPRRDVALHAAHRWPLGCVVAPVPHRLALELASVAVAPGGGGFLGKVFSHGVPMVAVPELGDQFEAAARVAWSGAGRRVDRRSPWTPYLPDPIGPVGQLRRAVVRVLADDRYRTAARHLATEAAALGPVRAAEVVERVLDGTLRPAQGPTR
jgi:UDP:flavonoid glycosyltransferase YjiC (YdhE family)